MALWDTIGFTHMTLGLVPETLDAVDMVVTVRNELRMADPKVKKV